MASYWVNTPTVSIPLFAQFDKGKSIIRDFPPKLTAGFAIFLVRDSNRVPLPPASNMATNSFSKEPHLILNLFYHEDKKLNLMFYGKILPMKNKSFKVVSFISLLIIFSLIMSPFVLKFLLVKVGEPEVLLTANQRVSFHTPLL